MDLQPRTLLSAALNETWVADCSPYCDSQYDLGYCERACWPYCNFYCPYQLPPPPSTPIIAIIHHPYKLSKFLITSITILATAFVIVCCYAFYIKFFLRPRRRRSSPSSSQEEVNETTHDQFLDEDHGPVLDHPIWYIQTIGLQPSVISSITVCKYKRGDGLVEGTECSVCLNEFQEDETLRLLPKCNHAFHLPCIDTWLRSHTNCPMCRAPIVNNAAAASSASASAAADPEETRIGIHEGNHEVDGEADRELRNETVEVGELDDENRRKRFEDVNEVEDGMQPMRRSVSLDSLSAFKISHALANFLPDGSDRNSARQMVREDESGMEAGRKKVGGNKSLLTLMTSSSIGRSLQTGSSSLKRSFSCSGKLFLSRYSRSRNSDLPL